MPLILTKPFQGILKSRQAIALSEFLNLEDLQRRTDDAAAFDKGQAKGHATGDLSMRKRDRKELDDLTIDEIQSAAQGAMEDKPVTVGMPLEGRAEHALNEMTADEIQGAAQGVVDEKPVSIGAPLSRRTSHELNELTFEEAENTSERVVADRPVTVGMPEEQRDGLTSEAEHLTKTPAPDLNMPAPFG